MNQKNVRKKGRRVLAEIRKNKVSYLMLAPFFVLFFFFTVIPIISAFGLSFTYFNMLETPKLSWGGQTIFVCFLMMMFS